MSASKRLARLGNNGYFESEAVRKYYILAERNSPSAYWGKYQRVSERFDWRTNRIAAKHDAMVEQPQALARLLHEFSLGECVGI